MDISKIKLKTIVCLIILLKFNLSCVDKKRNFERSQNNLDNLYLSDSILKLRYPVSNLQVQFLNNNNIIKKIPLNDTVILNIKYLGSSEKISKNIESIIFINKLIYIKKIKSNKYKIFVPKNYTKEELVFDYSIKPTKNYLLNFEGKIINNSDYFTLFRYSRQIE